MRLREKKKRDSKNEKQQMREAEKSEQSKQATSEQIDSSGRAEAAAMAAVEKTKLRNASSRARTSGQDRRHSGGLVNGMD